MNQNSKIPFNDLSREAANEKNELLEVIERVIGGGWFVQGPEHKAFEQELAEFHGVETAIGVGNGTDALEIALRAIGVTQKSRVLTVANAGGYTTAAATLIGANVEYCDIDQTTLQISLETLKAHTSEFGLPDVVVVTHLFGAAAPIDEICRWAHSRQIKVIEDCAQAIGALCVGKPIGSFGDAATLSFYPTKNLGAIGDGGAILTSSAEIADRALSLRQYGWTSKYSNELRNGRNSRLDEIQAAVLRIRLQSVKKRNSRRLEIYEAYESAVRENSTFKLVNKSSPSFVGHLAVIQTEFRDELRQFFEQRGISTEIHYPMPDYSQAAWKSPSETPNTEKACREVFSIPLFPELEDAEVARICQALRELSESD